MSCLRLTVHYCYRNHDQYHHYHFPPPYAPPPHHHQSHNHRNHHHHHYHYYYHSNHAQDYILSISPTGESPHAYQNLKKGPIDHYLP